MFTDEMAIVVREITVTSLRTMYTEGKVTSQNLWSPYNRHLVGKTRHNNYVELRGEDLSCCSDVN